MSISPAIVHVTSDRVLRVQGPGSRQWVNAMLTADVRAATPGTARYALLLHAAGGIVSDAWVVDGAVQEPEGLALILPAACAERAAEVLDRVLFSEQIALSFDDAVRVVSLQGPRARELLDDGTATKDAYSCARLGPEGLDVWVKASEVDSAVTRLVARAHALGGRALDAREWSSARVMIGVPEAGVDFDESTSPHEAGLDGRAVSFTKGCFPGQEVVARQRRGELTRQLTLLDAEANGRLARGSIVRGPSGEAVGRVTSVAPTGENRSVALAYVTPPFAQPGARVVVHETPAHVRRVVGRPWPVLAPSEPLA